MFSLSMESPRSRCDVLPAGNGGDSFLGGALRRVEMTVGWPKQKSVNFSKFSDAESNTENIAVPNDVIFAFQSEMAVLFAFLQAGRPEL